MKVVFKVVFGLVAALAIGAVTVFFIFKRDDIPYETLEQRYAVATSHYVDLPSGVRAHYRDDGPPNAPVVLLVHGFGDSFLSWEGWIHVLSQQFRVITVDVPGHGLTRAPDNWTPNADSQVAFIDEFAAAVQLPPFAIVGNSMGGGIAWRTTLAHPERVRALVLLDAAGFANENPAPPNLAFQLLSTPVGRFLLENVETRPITDAALKTDVVDRSLITPEFVNRWVEVQRAPGHRRILMSYSPGAGLQADPARLAEIHVPTLVQWGEADRLLDVASARKFHDAIPGAELIIYPNVGHLPQVEIPERSATDAAAFLRRALLAGAPPAG